MMANGFVGAMGQPGERESTQHGVVNDITVPTLRLRGMIICDELMIGAAMLLLPIGATLLHKWVLPVYALILTALLFRHVLDGVEDSHTAAVKLFCAGTICLIVFGVGALFQDAVFERLDSAWGSLWQWPPKVGLFLYKIAFLSIPFFVPIFTRTPLLTRFFETTLRDPTWPSPRTAMEIEGIQYAYPEPKVEDDPGPHIRVEVQEDEHTTTIGNIPDTTKMLHFAHLLINGRAFSKAESGMSRKDWLAVRDEFLARGWAKWKNPDSKRQGLKITKAGYTALLGYVNA